MAEIVLRATREQILGFRRSQSHLDGRLPMSIDSLRRAAWTGLADSMPRAAQLSLHARVDSVTPTTWESPAFVQVWGPRFSAYVVARQDVAAFTLGRLPESGNRRRVAEETIARLAGFLSDRQMTYSDVGKAMGVAPNSLRYATLTGRVRLRWEGSGKPLIRVVDRPDVDEGDARRELVRRYLHVCGPATPGSFASWAGVSARQAQGTFETLGTELAGVDTPSGVGFILAADEPALLAEPEPTAAVRLLPSGDTYYLLQGADRELLVADEKRRSELWTSRVWPGAVLLSGEIAGTWRRRKGRVSISSWRSLSSAENEAVEDEAESFPLTEQPISVSWD